MKRDELDRAFGETPELFSRRIDDTLRDLTEEEKPVKRFTLRTALITALIFILLCTAAYAIVSGQGLSWYYDNRYTALQETNPEGYNEILQNLQTDVPQEESSDTDNIVRVTVQDYAWAKDTGIFTLSLAAVPNDPDHVELHPAGNMNADGWDDERTVNWLWTDKGFGLPADVMTDPTKQLMLFEADMWGNLTIGDTGVPMPASSFDAFDGADGTVISVPEIDLNAIDPAQLAATFPESYDAPDLDKLAAYEGKTLRPDTANSAGNNPVAVKRLQEALTVGGFYAGEADGVYSDAVVEAGKAYQKSVGLTADGVAGPYTQAMLLDGVSLARERGDVAAAIEQRLLDAAKVRDALSASRDAEGNVTLHLTYTVTPFDKENDSFGTPVNGEAVFKVKIPE